MTNVPQKAKGKSLTNRVKELLKDISPFIYNASEDQKRRLLVLLEELRQTDRRRHPRKEYSAAVTYATLDRVFKAFVRNICDGGVFIETGEPLVPGEEITLTISFPKDPEPVKLTGEIVWSIEERGIGVRFTTPNHDLKAKIRSL
jgi:uncharacterized protein (TIGR02266 family)